jgi:hypothetical protein
MLYHPDVGFSERRYVDLNLCLKQIKLRQSSLEILMQRPDLYDRKKTEEGVFDPLECLMEMKRADRMHILKLNCAFPIARDLLTIETQYGDFVTDAELEGGCAEDETSTQAGSRKSKSSRSAIKKEQTLDKTQLPDTDTDDSDTGEGSSCKEAARH